ncbi:hypothetical protein CMUS01_10168 [Colletotrichum musicola]|uniref:Zn(2)-C6 fungal-type domain-containing protein n=1 Tax=Colletotrichum musicola TaxID=2175873 RepID=A0A8H6K537_9PEZI|nr:hypothetical protein CMUS01_10168 [Colletotrichum musicola]
MPNTGKPSLNCHLCRRRRVKVSNGHQCDLGRPQCQRCIKYGVSCPGYRDEQDVRFQHADAATFERRRRKKKDAAEAEREETASPASWASSPSSHESLSSLSSSPSSVSSVSLSSPLPRSVRQHWTAECIPLVLGCYSSIAFLPGLFRGVGEDHCLVRTGQVFARAYVMNRSPSGADYRDLSTYLGKALASVSSAIRDPEAYASDATIVAVWLLGNYETIEHRLTPGLLQLLMGGLERRSFISRDEQPPSEGQSWHIHSKGLISLLRARGDRQLYTRSGRQIFWVMHNIIQIQCTITNSPCPPEFARWLAIIEHTQQPGEALPVRTGRYIASACSLLSRMMPVVRRGDMPAACEIYEEILKECDQTELTMLEWIQSSSAPDAAPEHRPGEGPVSSYFWNCWRSARIKLQHMILLLANLVSHAPGCPFEPGSLAARRQLCMDIIASAAADVVEGIPGALDAADDEADSPAAYFAAVRLVWPLSHVHIVPSAPRDLRIAAGLALRRIGREKGILTALRPRPGSAGFPPEALAGLPIGDDLGMQNA